MATIEFKGKVRVVYHMDDTVAYRYIDVPVFGRNHCDMRAFRKHPKYGSYANSDLFAGMLSRIRADTFKGAILKLDNIPEGVHVDTSKFLAVVKFDV